MASILIVYGTTEGQTAKIARHMADVLTNAGHITRVAGTRDLSKDLGLHDFDGVLVGASVHRSKHDRRIVEWVRANRAALEDLRCAFFSVSLTAAGTSAQDKADLDKLFAGFTEQTGWHPDRIGVFAGALLYTQYNPLIRFLMKRIVKKYGGETDTSRDYEYTDWDAVTGFAKDFAETLSGDAIH